MKYEYYYEYFMNAFMNTFLRGMNTLDTLRGYTYLFKKNNNIRSIVRTRTLASVRAKSIHSIHQQSQSIHKTIHRVSILPFIFLEVDYIGSV